jgi:hypothetical protein
MIIARRLSPIATCRSRRQEFICAHHSDLLVQWIAPRARAYHQTAGDHTVRHADPQTARVRRRRTCCRLELKADARGTALDQQINFGRRRVIVKITFRPTGEHESSQLLGALQQLGTQVNMMHLRTIRLGEELEATYSLTLLPSVEEAYAVESLMKLTSVDDINIFSADELEEP